MKDMAACKAGSGEYTSNWEAARVVSLLSFWLKLPTSMVEKPFQNMKVIYVNATDVVQHIILSYLLSPSR
jgi:hypothetical protein